MAKTLDLFEYATNAAANAAYPSSDQNTLSAKVAQLLSDGTYWIGTYAGTAGYSAQSFTLDRPTLIMGVAWEWDDIVGSPTGNMHCKIQTDDGDKPSGTLADANATKDFTIVGNQWNDVEFDTPFILPAGLYWIVMQDDGQENGNYWKYKKEGGNVYGDGKASEYYSGSWHTYSNIDVTFKVYSIPLRAYSEDTIKEQGSYSLRVEALKTDSLGDTLTRTVSPTVDLSGINTLKLWCYASRTGTNITVKIHDSGGTTTTINVVIASSNTWTEITADISGVADADKDAIDQIQIKITNADAFNLLYFDNFYGVEIQAYPIARLNKNRISGYHCFMDQYIRAKRLGLEPLKLPDGTVF